MMEKKNKIPFKKRIPRIIFLIGYVASTITLIVEACIPGNQSAAQSANVGQAVGSLINDIYGDQAKFIEPTKCSLISSRYEYYVGEKGNIYISTTPDNSSYQSYTYTTHNDELVNINSDGSIEFLKEGEVEITATNNHNNKIKDTKLFKINRVDPSKLTSTIDAEIDRNDNAYILLTNKTYIINHEFKPENTTYKNVTYSFSDNALDYISLTEDTITPISHSGSTTFNIYATAINGLTSTLKCKTIDYEYVEPNIDLEGYKVSNITKYADQTSPFSVAITPIPVNATNPQYNLISLDPSLAVITNDKKIKLSGQIGTVDIKIESINYPDITKIFTVTVNERALLNDIKLNLDENIILYEGSETKINVSPLPNYALIKSTTYHSSNVDVATISSNGIISAISAGYTTISVTSKGSDDVSHIKYIYLEVKVCPPDSINDILLNKPDNDVGIINYKQKIDLREYYSIKSFLHDDDVMTTDYTDFNYIFDNQKIKITDTYYIAPLVSGEILGYIRYTNQQNIIIQKEIRLLVIYDFSYSYDEDDSSLQEYDFNIYTTHVFNINDEAKLDTYELPHYYEITSSNDDVVEIKSSSSGFYIKNIKSGTSYISITPIYEFEENYEIKSKIIKINVKDILIDSLIVNFIDNNGKTIIRDDGNPFTVYVSNTINISPIVDDKVTKTDFIYEILDSSIASIKNNVLTFKKAGDLSLKILDKASNIENNFLIQVRNIIEFEGLTFTGHFNKDNNGNIIITNGESAKIVPTFTNNTTYKKVTYKVSNEDIASINNDGAITTKKAGNININIKCDDGYTNKELNINITIRKKNLTDDIENFMVVVRKVLGHYGAFLILGIFSTFTYYFYLKEKYSGLARFINFFSGFLIASFTEFLQTITPARAGLFSDVVIDYTGFLTSALIISLILFIIDIIIYSYRRKKEIIKKI